MKARISALMDGELEARESAQMIAALREQGEAVEAWRTYHLISDAMRGTRLLSADFAAHLAERLAAEPTVLAPGRVAPAAERLRWLPLSVAASVAAVALVGWLAFAPQPGVEPAPAPIAQVPVLQSPPTPLAAAGQPAQVPLTSAANDYLIAHHAYSPRGSLQGVAPYVRSVAASSGTR